MVDGDGRDDEPRTRDGAPDDDDRHAGAEPDSGERSDSEWDVEDVTLSTDEDAPDEEGNDWQFSLDDVGEDGLISERTPIEPGSPTLENTLFVLLGVLLTVLAIWRVVVVFTA